MTRRRAGIHTFALPRKCGSLADITHTCVAKREKKQEDACEGVGKPKKCNKIDGCEWDEEAGEHGECVSSGLGASYPLVASSKVEGSAGKEELASSCAMATISAWSLAPLIMMWLHF